MEWEGVEQRQTEEGRAEMRQWYLILDSHYLCMCYRGLRVLANGAMERYT